MFQEVEITGLLVSIGSIYAKKLLGLTQFAFTFRNGNTAEVIEAMMEKEQESH